jgi:large subunit ribosomal protein L7/L12
MALTDKAQKILDLLKELNAVEINELVKSLEEEFGVSAAAPMMMAGWAAGWAAEEAVADDKVTVMLTEIGQQKIGVIKVIKEVLGIDLKAAKDLVEQAPVAVKEKVSMEEGEEIKAKLTEVGASVAFK